MMKPLTAGTFWIWPIIIFCIGAARGSEVSVARWSGNTLVLDNGAVLRKVVYDAKKQTIRTTELKLPGEDFNFVGRASDEFSFEIDGKAYRGDSGWEVKTVAPMSGEREGQGAEVVLQSARADSAKIEVKIVYLLYPKLPVIRKKLVLKNLADREVKVESLDVENLRFAQRPAHV
jgi:alpha-galactosidase